MQMTTPFDMAAWTAERHLRTSAYDREMCPKIVGMPDISIERMALKHAVTGKRFRTLSDYESGRNSRYRVVYPQKKEVRVYGCFPPASRVLTCLVQ